jgi:hypothetical protein
MFAARLPDLLCHCFIKRTRFTMAWLACLIFVSIFESHFCDISFVTNYCLNDPHVEAHLWFKLFQHEYLFGSTYERTGLACMTML